MPRVPLTPLDSGRTRTYRGEMRIALAAALLLVAACSDDAMPTGLDGTWRVTWACVENCEQRPLALLDADTLTVDGGAATWNTQPAATVEGARDGECVTLADGTPAPHPSDIGLSLHDFALCEDAEAVALDVYVIGQAGAFQARWHMSGARE